MDALGLNADQVNQKLASLTGLPSAQEVKDLKKRLEIAEKTLIDQGNNIALAHEKCAGFKTQFADIED